MGLKWDLVSGIESLVVDYSLPLLPQIEVAMTVILDELSLQQRRNDYGDTPSCAVSWLRET